jgi:hypothetical protein
MVGRDINGMGGFMGFVFRSVWTTYDWFWNPGFGDGERAEGS